MDDLGVADELERHEVQRLGDVVVGDGVLVAIDRGQHEPTHRPDIGKRRRDRIRVGQVEDETRRGAADLGNGPFRIGRVLAAEDHGLALVRIVPGDPEADRPRPPDDDDRSVLARLIHVVSSDRVVS